MIDNIERIGNFTSSQIYRLLGSKENGDITESFYTYVEEKMHERFLGRSLDTGASNQSTVWGTFLEKYVHDNLLGLEYKMHVNKTTVHPKYDFFSGSPDFEVEGKKISELKCYQPKKFAAYASALLTEDPYHIKEKFPKEYWQIVGNNNIYGYRTGEALLFMPYASEMESIREKSMDPDYLNAVDLMPYQVRFIYENTNSQLAVLPDNSKSKNFYKFEFEIPIEDSMHLINRVIKAGSYLK